MSDLKQPRTTCCVVFPVLCGIKTLCVLHVIYALYTIGIIAYMFTQDVEAAAWVFGIAVMIG